MPSSTAPPELLPERGGRKEPTVKDLRAPGAVLGGLAAAAIVAGTALAHATAFSATYKGTVTEKVNGQTVTATVRGSGTGTPLGRGTISGTVVATTAPDSPCAPFRGPGVISGKNGKLKVTVVPTSRGCAAGEDDRNNISVAGSVKVTGGTGKYRKARGTLRFTGHYDRGSGAFSVKLKGTLST
jgi:hypothetical protein